MHRVYLGLGANLGDREDNIASAIKKIGELIGSVVRQSALYETEPWGFESDHQFINAAVAVDTTLTPHEVLAATQGIERTLGRTVKSADGVYHDRPIDIDILMYDDITVDDDDLKIPHPHLYERDFVMRPLNEIK
jgi:2-amino-4-hydroxy-6-hydroxymethyldihydropteridine diphosphokinase